jgi:hypothetical protein
MATINELGVQEVKERVVAIVRFGPGGFSQDGMRPGEYYQVTIDPRMISPSGKYIRFGNSPGDEIVGWQRCEAMSIEEILWPWPLDQEEPPQLEYGSQGTVTMLIPKVAQAA